MSEEIAVILNSISSKWACLRSDGTLVNTSLKDETISKSKIIRILKTLVNETHVESVIIFSDLVVYRPVFDMFIFIMERVPRNLMRESFSQISNKFKESKKSFKKKKSKHINIELSLFSMSLEEGPEPVFYIPRDYDEDLIFKVCMKSLLSLQVESEGASKDMISFQPFVDLDSLGIVNTFQIKDKNARGGAFDSALTILVDYKYRAIIYENYSKIEKIFSQARNKIIRQYNSDQKYKKILQSLKDSMTSITFESIKAEDLKSEMIEQIKKLL
ncbi:MAG: hypothetical protein GF353_02910 [Candidatus Lokiarchaeota archaeon]|nr:hypothetical protein [Candidatus Lokiarchaeota archaeon]